MKRAAVTFLIACSLFVGVSAVPATASPADEAIYLSAMKGVWKTQTPKTQKTTCFAYRVAPDELISKSVAIAREDPTAAEALNKRAWTRVISAYLEWACSGPGTTPR